MVRMGRKVAAIALAGLLLLAGCRFLPPMTAPSSSPGLPEPVSSARPKISPSMEVPPPRD